MNPWEQSIILVEDDPSEVLLLEQAFKKAKLKNPVQVFRDGQEVMDYLSQQITHVGTWLGAAVPALMLLDLKMPRRTGFEVLEWLRGQAGLKRLVVIVLSNSDLHNDIDRAYDCGCNSYLLKPRNVDQWVELVSVIERYWLLVNKPPELTRQS